MRPISITTPASDPRAGFSLLEMLVVLAIMALATAIVFPRGVVMTDRIVAQAVFFDFQRKVADLRREAYRSQSPLVLYPSKGGDPADPRGRVIPLRAGWTYLMQRPMQIGEGGGCSASAARILDKGVEVMRLATSDGACHFIRAG